MLQEEVGRGMNVQSETKRDGAVLGGEELGKGGDGTTMQNEADGQLSLPLLLPLHEERTEGGNDGPRNLIVLLHF